MTVTKADLVNRLSEATGLSKTDLEVVLNGFMASIIESIEDGDRVEIRGFGSFYAKEREARKVKNPKTNKVVDVDHRFVPVFRPAKNFKEMVNKKLLEKKEINIDE